MCVCAGSLRIKRQVEHATPVFKCSCNCCRRRDSYTYFTGYIHMYERVCLGHQYAQHVNMLRPADTAICNNPGFLDLLPAKSNVISPKGIAKRWTHIPIERNQVLPLENLFAPMDTHQTAALRLASVANTASSPNFATELSALKVAGTSEGITPY